jgi:hypothetical protein
MIQIYQNVLSDDVMKIVETDLKTSIGKYKWMSSSLIWDENIKINITGSCMFCELDDHMKNIIKLSLKGKIPEYDDETEEIYMKYYIWQKDSGISWHNDGGRKSAATLYLNKEWSINDGGLFVWEDLYLDNPLQAYVPKYNSLIVNDDQTRHMVTPVSALSKQNRFTIQMFITAKNIN